MYIGFQAPNIINNNLYYGNTSKVNTGQAGNTAQLTTSQGSSFANLLPVNILPAKNQKDFKSGGIVIPPEANALAGQLYKAKIANVFSKEWSAVLNAAAQANGGLGSPEQGFLAWSNEGHFVRLNNPRLSPEQNQKLAEISLKSGIAVEDLPSRWETQSSADPKVNEKLDTFISDFETKFAQMQNGQSTSLEVKDKKHIFSMNLDQESGYVVSDHQKEKNWFQKLAGKGLKYLGPVLDVVSKYAGYIPGWGTIAAAGAAAVKWGLESAATGKAKIQGLFSAAATAVGGYLGSASSWLGNSTVGKAIGSIANSGSWSEAVKNLGNVAIDYGKDYLKNYLEKYLGNSEKSKSEIKA